MKIKKNLSGILAVVLATSVLALCAGCTDKGQVQLQLHLKEGESYNLRTLTAQKISQTIQGEKQETMQTMDIGHTYNVGEVDADGIASIKVTYHSVLLKRECPTGNIEYDSSNPPDVIPPAAMGFAALVGNSFSVKISPKGQVNDIQGVDAMLTKMIEQLDLPDEAIRNSIEKNLKNQFGEQSLKEIVQNSLAVYPDKPIGIGDSWTKKVAISKGFPMIIDSTWTLKERKDGIAIIDWCSNIKPNLEAPPMEIGNINISYHLSGEQEGTLKIEEATGWIDSAKSVQQLSGNVTVENSLQASENMSWPISIETITSIESSVLTPHSSTDKK